MAGIGNDGAFQRALARFKSHITQSEQEKFSITSLEDVQETIAQIQSTQGSKRRMRNLTRLKGFIEAMEQYGKIVEVFLNVSEIIAFIWGPIKFLLQTASTWVESFDVLLDAYEEIGENLPQLLKYGELFNRHAHMRKVLELMYGDILEFHRRALRFFSRPTWKQLFHSSWKTFRTQFQCILTSLSRHKHLVESQASLVEYEQSNAARVVAQSNFEDAATAERLRRRLAVTEKINAPSILTDHEAFTDIRQEYPDSGRWILQHPLFKNWKDFTSAHADLLWINGIPGAGILPSDTKVSRRYITLADIGSGKTMIASLIVEEMRAIDSVDLAFFYCKYNDNQKSSFTSILRGILVQLIQQNEDLLSYVYDACCSNSEVTLDSPSRLKSLVEMSLRSSSRCCVIVDGIDECEETEEKKIIEWFLAIIERIPQHDAVTIRLLFVSQRDKVTESLLASAAVITLDSNHHQEDIRAYAGHWSEKLQRKFGISEGSASQISTAVADQAKGLFLFAKLVLTHLYSQTTRARLFAEVQPECFPTGLDTAYERIALRVFENPNQAEREDAHNIFRWIICAKRPLKWRDVQSIFAIDPNLHRVDVEERQIRVTCRELCGSLVETGAGDKLVLVHQSAKQYLIKTSRISVPAEDLHIAGFCVHYLNFGCFNANLTESEIRDFLRHGYYSFEDYAVAHWLDHVASSTSQPLPLEAVSLERLKQELESFFTIHGLEPPPDVSASTQVRFQSIRHWDFTKKLDCLANLARQRESRQRYLDLEAQLQRRRLVYEDIVTNPGPGNDDLRRNLLLNASGWFKCHQRHCDSFFDGFSNVKDRDNHISQHERPFRCSFRECLHAKLGYATGKELEKHIKRSHPTGQYTEWAFPKYKPKKDLNIFSAASKGDLATVKRLVEEGADVKQTTRPKGRMTALILAVRNRHSDIVMYLLEKQWDTENVEFVMKAAVLSGRAIVQKVLDTGENSTKTKDLAQAALFTAAVHGQDELIPLLLDYGININKNDWKGWTALDYARRHENDSFVRCLRDHGALDNVKTISEYSEQPPTPTPATPVTPQFPISFTPANADRQSSITRMPGASAAAPDQVSPQNDNVMSGSNGLESEVESYGSRFNTDPNNTTILESMSLARYSAHDDYSFDPTTSEPTENIEPERNDPEFTLVSPYQTPPSPRLLTTGVSQSITFPYVPFDPQSSKFEQFTRRHPDIPFTWKLGNSPQVYLSQKDRKR